MNPLSCFQPTSSINHLQYIVIVIHQSSTLYGFFACFSSIHSFGNSELSIHPPSCTLNHYYNLLIESRNAFTSFLLIPPSPRLPHSPTRSPWAQKSTITMSSPLLQHGSHPSTWKTDPPSRLSNLYPVPRRECRRPRHDQYHQATIILRRYNRTAVCSCLHCRHWHALLTNIELGTYDISDTHNLEWMELKCKLLVKNLAL